MWLPFAWPIKPGEKLASPTNTHTPKPIHAYTRISRLSFVQRANETAPHEVHRPMTHTYGGAFHGDGFWRRTPTRPLSTRTKKRHVAATRYIAVPMMMNIPAHTHRRHPPMYSDFKSRLLIQESGFCFMYNGDALVYTYSIYGVHYALKRRFWWNSSKDDFYVQ